MIKTARKKSTSSESELSDGWSLVDHPDTAPLAPQSGEMSTRTLAGIARLHSVSSHAERSTSQAQAPTPIIHDENSSDSESVDILQEVTRVSHAGYPHYISSISKINSGEIEKEQVSVKKDATQVKQVILSEPASDFLVNANIHSNERFRLFVFISSLVALLLLLISYASLLFKEHPYSKSDGMVALPDEDLSSLIADLTLFKEENSRLKEKLNMMKYEYGGNDNMLSGKSDDLDIISSDDIVGLEIISDDSPQKVESYNPSLRLRDQQFSATSYVDPPDKAADKLRLPSETNKYRQENIKQEQQSTTRPNKEQPKNVVKDQNSTDKASRQHRQKKDEADNPTKKIENLLNLEDNLKTFVVSLNLKNVVVSAYNIAQNLNSIDVIVNDLRTIIDKETPEKKENKKNQLEQKLFKLHNKIEQDFKKIIEKVGKRISKFHSEFLYSYCRIKGGVSDSEKIDCSILNQNQNENRHKEYKKDTGRDGDKRKMYFDNSNYNSESKDSVEKPGYETVASDQSALHKIPIFDDSKDYMRYKRNSNDKHDNYAQHFKSYKSNDYEKNDNYKKPRIYNERKEYKNNKDNKQKNYDDDQQQQQRRLNEKQSNLHQHGLSNENKQQFYTNHDHSTKFYEGKSKANDKKNPKGKYGKINDYEDDRKANGKFKDKHYNYHSEEILQTEYKYFKDGTFKLSDSFKYDGKKTMYDDKCLKKNCDKKTDTFEQRANKYDNKNIYKDDRSPFGGKPSNPIHNESIYSKIVSNNGPRNNEANGEWYLDMGEVRNQKRLRRAIKDKNGWMLDRALIRDWCRTNAGSSLCASFGQNCDYCV